MVGECAMRLANPCRRRGRLRGPHQCGAAAGQSTRRNPARLKSALEAAGDWMPGRSWTCGVVGICSSGAEEGASLTTPTVSRNDSHCSAHLRRKINQPKLPRLELAPEAPCARSPCVIAEKEKRGRRRPPLTPGALSSCHHIWTVMPGLKTGWELGGNPYQVFGQVLQNMMLRSATDTYGNRYSNPNRREECVTARRPV